MADASQFRLPPALDLNDDNLAETFRLWRRQVEFYLIASGGADKPAATQTAIILHCAGVQVQEVYEHFVFTEAGDKDKPAKVLDKLAEYCSPRSNEVIETFRFWNTPYREPFDSFLTDLRSRANLCNFGDKKDRMLRDKIVFSTTGKMQELLLREQKLDLPKAVDICRAYEMTSKQTKEISEAQVARVAEHTEHAAGGASGVNRVRQPDRQQTRPARLDLVQNCNYCGRSHEALKTKCPAWGKVCRKCN